MKKLRDISINIKIFILFIFVLLGTSMITSYIPYSNWWDLIDFTSVNTGENLNEKIISQIDSFIMEGKYLNEMNKGLIEKAIIDIDDEVLRNRFFVNGLSSFNSNGIYSFSYGSELGEYYGARRNESNVIEIMKNNEETNGQSWYYTYEDEKAGEKILNAGEFDPRTRDWYKSAKETSQTIFSPVYRHFVLDDLVMSLSSPIYNKEGKLQGVLGTHVNLSRINDYLEEIVGHENACAMIIERESGNIIANCTNQPHYKKVENGQIERISIDEIGAKSMSKAYKEYLNSGRDNYKMDSENGDIYIKVLEYNAEGLEWIVITLLPESLMMSTIKDSIKVGLGLNILVIFMSSYIFYRAMKKYMNPINSLIQTQESFAKGNLVKREKIIRNDEIGMLAGSFNTMADMIYILINNLEKQVEERTQELKKSKDYFETIVLSVGDGIIATDDQGLITIINPVIENLTGWSNQEAYGRSLEEVLTIIYESTEKTYENPAKKVLVSGETIEKSGQPMLISKSKKNIFVEYTAAPIKNKEDHVIGTVIVLRDITDEKKHLDKIKHLSRYDQLTGLYNRWYIEDEIIRLNKEEHLPLTIMIIDVNGLKLVNDAFGHEMGDRLLKIVSNALKSVLRSEDIVGRVGGDEFLILLPKVNKDGAERVKERIFKAISLEKLESIIISVAIGYSVKENMEENIEDIRIFADNEMYKNKIIHGKTMRNKTIETVLRNINFKYDDEQIHTERVSEYCESIGRAMDFSEDEIEDLKITGVLHDIGKIVVPPELLNKVEKLTKEEYELIKKHPETGYHILKSVDEYMGLAKDVLYHHENWDGTGYPKGLKGEEIPLNARIISVADAFEAMTANRPYKKLKTKEEAIAELEKCAGSQFDPEIVKIFVEDVLG